MVNECVEKLVSPKDIAADMVNECVEKLHGLDLDLNGKRPGVASDGNFSSYMIVKGQLISKCLLGVIVSTKKPTKFF